MNGRRGPSEFDPRRGKPTPSRHPLRNVYRTGDENGDGPDDGLAFQGLAHKDEEES